MIEIQNPEDIKIESTMTLTVKAKDVTITEEKEEKTVKLSGVNVIDLFTDIVDPSIFKNFLDDKVTKNKLAKDIGVKGLLETFDRTEVCKEISWEFIKPFFYDHMNVQEILDHIGFDKVKEHFADKIAHSSPTNAINTTNTADTPKGGLLGALNDTTEET